MSPTTATPPEAALTCALLARAHDAELAGTAPEARGWVLVEQPGAWGRQALTSSALEPALGAHLDATAGDEVKVVLIRRPGARVDRTPVPRTVVLAHTGPTPWAERLTVDTDAQLWDLDPSLAAAPDPPGLGVALDRPLWLVCTHGKRDRCCAEYGRPIAAALAHRLDADDVWEVSHVGGHRFAGNLVSLPGGEVLGLLEVATAVRAVELHGQGRDDLAHLRGRSGLARPAQAAELLARRAHGLDRRDAVHVGAVTPRDDGSVAVALTLEGVAHVAVVRHVPTGVATLQGCDKDEPSDPGRFVLGSLERS